VCETPDIVDKDKQEALDLAKINLYILLDKKPFKKCFKETSEVVKKRGQFITTGNKLLPKNCSYCGYRKYCWPDSTYEKKPSVREDAKAHAWYSKYRTSDL
jgi:MoaA/NifB/PqqE/SkfB family radical SAM enzyme